MADIKISQLGAAVAVVDADVIPATANGVTVKVPASVLKEYAIGGTDISSIGDGTPTGAISALKSVKIEKTDIAPIETSVASKAYAVGDQLYYNGMLYSVIAAIAQGETLVVDTNIELSDKVTEQIKALKGSVDLVNADLQKEVTTRATLGAHNFLNLSLAEIKSLNTSGTWNGNAYTFRGVTFTINDDLSISTSGTVNTGNLAFYLKNNIPLKNGTYKMIGCPSGASSYELLALIGSTEYKDRGNGAEFTISNNTVSISIYTRLNQDMSGLTFKPQIILFTDSSTEFTPYAMTNKQLTDAVALSSETIATGLNVYKSGHVINIRGTVSIQNSSLTIGTRYQIATLDNKYKPNESFIADSKAHHYIDGITTYYKDAIISIMYNGALYVIPQELSSSSTTEFAINITYLV